MIETQYCMYSRDIYLAALQATYPETHETQSIVVTPQAC